MSNHHFAVCISIKQQQKNVYTSDKFFVDVSRTAHLTMNKENQVCQEFWWARQLETFHHTLCAAPFTPACPHIKFSFHEELMKVCVFSCFHLQELKPKPVIWGHLWSRCHIHLAEDVKSQKKKTCSLRGKSPRACQWETQAMRSYWQGMAPKWSVSVKMWATWPNSNCNRWRDRFMSGSTTSAPGSIGDTKG